MKTGMIGLGAMGYFMALNLHRAGLLGGVWNRTRAKAEALAGESGVAVAAEPAELARNCPVVVTCVSADGDLLEVVEALLPGCESGTVVVDTSTVSADTARQAAARLATVGAGFVDAPVSGGVEGARQGTLVVMAGGEPAHLEAARPALEAIGGRTVHMGPVGCGQATKAVNQIMVAGIAQGVTEALAFGRAMGLDLDRVIDVVGGGAAGNWFLNHRGPTLVRDSYSVGFKLALHHKDLTICKHMAEARGGRLPGVEQTLEQYRQLMEQGHGNEDISALYRLKKSLFPPQE